MHLLHLDHQSAILVFSHFQVITQRGKTGILALQITLEFHHGLLELAAVLPQRANLHVESTLLLLVKLSLLRLGLQLSVYCGKLGLELCLLLESLEDRTVGSECVYSVFHKYMSDI